MRTSRKSAVRMKKHILILLCLWLFQCVTLFAQYKIQVGSYQYLQITPPAGYCRSATWSCDQGLTLTERSEVGAIVKVTHYFEGAAYVSCSYVYEYLGSYDHNYHAGRGTQTFRITCVGGQATINETNIELTPGQKYKLKCVKSDSFGTPTWESSNEDVATVDNNGNVTAIASGNARITLDPIIAAPLFCDVRVKKINATSMKLSPDPLNVVVGKRKKVTPIYQPSGASADLTWKSENENIATVSSLGFVEGISEGTTSITALSDNGLSARVNVNVVSAPTSVNLPSDVCITTGYYYTLVPTLYPLNTETTYTWKTSDSSVASVSSNGKIYGKKEGSVIITVTTDNKLSASTEVKIVAPSSGIDTATMKYRASIIENMVKNITKK